jgi:hypothetical protein
LCEQLGDSKSDDGSAHEAIFCRAKIYKSGFVF